MNHINYGDPQRIYEVVRYHRSDPDKVIKKKLTRVEEAMHCQDPHTRHKDASGLVWFDGFRLMKKYREVKP